MTLLETLAARRTSLHADRSETHRALTDDCDEIGLAGEIAFGSFSGICPDFSDTPRGDDGYDFTVPLLYRVEVKSTKPGRNLIHREDKPLAADIYVLAEVAGDTTTLVGWCWRKTLAAAEVRVLQDGGPPSHFVPRSALRPMGELEERLWRVK